MNRDPGSEPESICRSIPLIPLGVLLMPYQWYQTNPIIVEYAAKNLPAIMKDRWAGDDYCSRTQRARQTPAGDSACIAR